MDYKDVIKFWFEEVRPEQYWVKDPEFDKLIESKFGSLHNKAISGQLASWRDEQESALAEIIILDQFSRNIYRNDKRSFAYDDLALELSMKAIEKGFDNSLSKEKLLFLYLPFMHSEDKDIHVKAVELFKSKNLDLEYEYKHKAIIDRFGRYPHRNKILGRESTPEEIEFLKGPDSSF